MGQDKLWLEIDGRALVALTISRAAESGCFDHVVIAAPQDRWSALCQLCTEAGLDRADVLEGGARRQDSVFAALERCDDDVLICVHDAARPLASPALFRSVVDAARRDGAATAAVPCIDTIKRVSDGYVRETLLRSELIATQTPQAFDKDLLVRAHTTARAEGVEADDDAQLVERLGRKVAVVPGDSRNLKVTHAADIALLAALLGEAT
jgi:2-C-methyl-D-erythritol 4-phosphate cytidylyltransferase